MFSMFLLSYRNTLESLGELEKAVETLACQLVFPLTNSRFYYTIRLSWAQDFFLAYKSRKNDLPYYMAQQIRAFWLVLSWSGFRHTESTVSVEMIISCIFFVFDSWQIQNKHGPSVPYINKLLTNLANSSGTEEYWPSLIFVRTSLRSTSGQYSPVRPSRSVSKRLILKHCCFYITFYLER